MSNNLKPILEVKNLVKKYGDKIANDNISFVINKGERVGLIGANGAGKTTLVEQIIQTQKPSSGEIVYGFDYKHSPQEKMGMQFQESSYPDGLTVKDVIDFSLEMYGANISKDSLETLLNLFQMKDFYFEKAKSLSGGQQQKLNVLLAIAHNPELVVLDEISTGLDIMAREEITDYVEKYIKEKNITTILISHHMGEIEKLCDRVIVLSKGKIFFDGKITEISKKYGSLSEFMKKFIKDETIKFNDEKTIKLRQKFEENKNSKNPIRKFKNYHQSILENQVAQVDKGGMYAVYKMLHRYYWKSIYGPFFTFAFPLTLFAILSTIMDAKSVFGGVVSMSSLSCAVIGMPVAIMELKRSCIMKRIGASPIKPSTFTIVIISYYTVVIFIAICLLTLLAYLMNIDNAEIFSGLTSHNGISMIGFIYGNIINIIMSLSIGFCVAAVAKGTQQAQVIGMFLFIPMALMSGQIVPMEFIVGTNPNNGINIVSQVFPFRYTTLLINGAWNGANIFVPESISVYSMLTPGATVEAYRWYEPIISYIYPFVSIAAASLFSFKKFSWSSAR